MVVKKNKAVTLNIIEATLTSLAGHEYSYVASLVAANKFFGFNIHLWVGRSVQDKIVSHLINSNKSPIKIIRYFIRSLRQIQKIFLYYRFFKGQQIFYVCTSGLIDLIICDYLHRIFKFENFGTTAFFHFHQFNKTCRKFKILYNMSDFIKQNVKILTTTNNLNQIFTDAGFNKTITINCPTFAPDIKATKIGNKFNKILYAGIARKDKGFPLVVDTIIELQTKYSYLPVVLQVAPPNSNRFDKATRIAINKLQKVANINHKIKLHKSAISIQQYQELFSGAISLLVYEKNCYKDKFSGVTLDSLYAGAPVITVTDTWMGDLTKKFEAGIVLDQPNIDNIKNAILTIIAKYDYYQLNAKKAAKYLLEIHDPKHTLQAVYDHI